MIALRRLPTGSDARAIEDVPVEQVAVGDDILVRAGEVIPVDGVIVSPSAMLDEAAVTGEPIPVNRQTGELARSGSLNAGETFELRASTTARESTYAGIVRMVSAAQTAKAPFVRMADRFALLFLPLTLMTAGGAWFFSGDPIRALAVLVASTPCPLILAAPVAFIAGVAQAARRGILVKGSGPLEALARTHTVMFDKTGTLTVGGARLVAIEAAPGQSTDEILRIAAHSSRPRITWLPPRSSRLRWPRSQALAPVGRFARRWVPAWRVSSMGERCGLDRINWSTAPAKPEKWASARFAACVVALGAERICRGRRARRSAPCCWQTSCGAIRRAPCRRCARSA